MMVSFDISALEILIYGTIVTAVIGYIIERILTWHESRIVTIQKRSDEFIEISKRWYMPLTFATGAIAGETDPAYKILRSKVLFFELAKFLSLYSNFLDSSVGYIFPKETQENKVLACGHVFNTAVNLLVFKDNKELVEHTIERYRDTPDFVSFINEIEEFPAYTAVKPAIDNKGIRVMLYGYANEFKKSISDGVTEAYKVWYKFEFNKSDIIQRIQKSEKETITELHEKLSKNRGDCMDKVPNTR